MKLVLFCLFAVCCCSLASRPTARTDRNLQRKKLQEVLKQLKAVKDIIPSNERMLNTPPSNIEDCCCLSALQCFRTNLQEQFNVTQRNQSKLYRSLKHPITESGLDFCNSQDVRSTCQDCTSHPKENTTEFFNRLESLIQRAISRLSMN